MSALVSETVTELGDLSRGQLALRLVVLAGPVLAVLATGPAGHWPPWWVLVAVVGLATGYAAFPESPLGSVTMMAALLWWAVSLDDGLHPAVLGATAALLAAHVAAVVASYGPGEMPVDPTLVRVWVRRALLLLTPAPLVWLLALVVRGAPDDPQAWVVGVLAGLLAAVVAAVALAARPGGEP